MITMTAAAHSEIPEEEVPEYLSSGNHTFGLCGDFTGWEEFGDLMLADPDGDGLYVGYIKDPGEGEHQFKVRADGDWQKTGLSVLLRIVRLASSNSRSVLIMNGSRATAYMRKNMTAQITVRQTARPISPVRVILLLN